MSETGILKGTRLIECRLSQQQAPPQKWSALPVFGYLYFLRNPQGTHVKIGVTQGPLKRIRDLRYEVDLSNSTIFRFPTPVLAHAAEQRLHKVVGRFRDMSYGTNGGYTGEYAKDNHPGYTEWFKIEAEKSAKAFLKEHQKICGWWSENSAHLVARKPTPFQKDLEPTPFPVRTNISTLLGNIFPHAPGLFVINKKRGTPDQCRFFIAVSNNIVTQTLLGYATDLQLSLGRNEVMRPFGCIVAASKHLAVIEAPLIEPNNIEHFCRETPSPTQACLEILNLPRITLPMSSDLMFRHIRHKQYQPVSSLDWPIQPVGKEHYPQTIRLDEPYHD